MNRYIIDDKIYHGDPLHENNIIKVLELVNTIRLSFPEKTIWLYTGYMIESLFDTHVEDEVFSQNLIRLQIVKQCDVVVDGEYIDELRDVTLHWKGSSNQRVIDAKKTFALDNWSENLLELKEIYLYERE